MRILQVMATVTSTDGSSNHAVTIFQGIIFDATEDFALELGVASLDRCAGSGGVFMEFGSFITLRPKKNILESRARKSRDCINDLALSRSAKVARLS